MIVKSRLDGLQDWLFIEEIPDAYNPTGNISEKRLTVERSPIKMTNYHLCSSGLFLMHSNMKFSQSVKIHTGIEGETVTSQFVFNNSGSKSYHGSSRHNIRFIPSSSSSYELKSGSEYDYFLMVISKDYYYRLIDRHSSLHEDFVQSIDNGISVSFAQQDMKVTPEMQRIIQEILESKKTGEIKRLHLEAKVLELLIYQIEQLNSERGEEDKFLKDRDIEKLERAKEILEKTFIEPPTQRELALEVMLNESKLRKGFKEYFAITIYDYITRLRMELAKRLLTEENKSIYEVAGLTGFKHQANFSIAFKKYFGISPSEIE